MVLLCRRTACSSSLLVLLLAVQAGIQCAAATEDNASGSTGTTATPPYDLDSIPDLQTLLWRHQHYQTAALLSDSMSKPPAVIVTTNDLVGLGNRVPSMVTGFVMALLTGRLFILHSTWLTLVDMPFPANWSELMARYAASTRCSAHWTKLAGPDLNFCSDEQQQQAPEVDLIYYGSIDYDLPLLQINPSLAKYFQKFFLDGNVFHSISRHLFRPKPAVQEAMQPYLPLAQQCLIGMHIRTRKYAGVRVKQFTSIGRMISQGQQGTVFVASDADLFQYVQEDMPQHQVWWSNHTRSALQAATTTRGMNPGTELSAVMDMLFLSMCKNLILTPSSSLGSVAAGLAGIQPVFANFGRHEDPFLNPWFWKSLTTEPCMFKASTMHLANDTVSTRFRDTHPMYLYHNQCHYQHRLRRAPTYLKLSTANTSYIESLVN